ncbi:glycosyl hydrolase [Mucilaginibacter terrae]|uniref:glycosyl hydrolase n=1 Tax=Mucilaginibacter terrae TaxID=1955052 RepID=UPI003640404D
MMKPVLLIKLLISSLALFITIGGYAQENTELSNAKASDQAKALYKYLQDMRGKKILSGQMVSNFGRFDELKYIKEVTGKQPALRGMDFIDSAKNKEEVKFAKEWWVKGGIPTIMWHWGAPGKGGGYTNSQKPVDIDRCFEEGTPEYKAFWAELDRKAKLLKKLKRARVPVLWRPFHELNGNWFWWGKQGPEKFKRLWTTMYNYYVKKKKLNNLIWVLCYTGKPDSAWYPGSQYVDIASADTYGNNSPHLEMYNKVHDIAGDKMPIAFHECGTPPNPDKTLADGAQWSWWMVWHTSHIAKVDKDYLKHVYSHEQVVTLDEVPDIMRLYGTRHSFFYRLFH